ncbi:MAG TPA: hypothetical protein VEU32_18450 [Burkholderiales bacterium]|jgi:hypothetical protein|nr:hypothetical protein [Burkholderiales bacterium]
MKGNLDSTMQALFARWPALCGFAVEELRSVPNGRQIVFRDVAIQPWAGVHPSPELMSDLAASLLDFADESDQAAEELAGRTFAPSIH